MILRQDDPLQRRTLGERDGQRRLANRSPVTLIALQQAQPGTRRQVDRHPRGVRPGAARHQPERGQGLLARRDINPRVAAIDQHMVVSGQTVERSRRQGSGERLRGCRQYTDQPAQVGPAPVLVTSAGQLANVSGPDGRCDAHAAFA